MADLIYVAVVVAFFAAGGLHACWCEKLWTLWKTSSSG
jgi:hypothetical protein